MTFTAFCVGFVILVIICAISAAIGFIMTGESREEYAWAVMAWIISSTGFAVCFTILLYQNGIIK